MGKELTEQIAEALAPMQKLLDETRDQLHAREAELAERDRHIDVLIADGDEWQKRALDMEERVRALEAELSEARGIIAHQAGEVSAARREIGDGVDLSAAIYRDALADFAIRVLSGGVAVSFHEARP